MGSLQNLQPNSQDTSVFYLSQIYRLTPGSNVSSVPIPSDPAAFVPPSSAIWVNTLWSLSLVISLSCALLATLLQQWTRRYLRITRTGYDPQKRARIRELMLLGMKRLIPLRWMVELLPTLLHISVFLFLIGFVIYLSTFNHFVAKVVGVGAGTSALLYLCVSFVPIIFRNSPYYTPLSRLIWVFSMSFISLGLGIRYFATLCCSGPEVVGGIRESFRSYFRRIPRDMAKEAVTLAHTSSYLDAFILVRTFESLDGDRDTAQFLANLPGFYASSKVTTHGSAFERLNSQELPSSIASFMDHILSSNQLNEATKCQHIKTCLEAIAAYPPLLQCTFREVLHTSPDSNIFRCADFVSFAHSAFNNTDTWVKSFARCIVAIAINRVPIYNSDWAAITWRYLGMEANPHQANNMRLRNLTHLTRHLKRSQLKYSDEFRSKGVWKRALKEAAQKLEVGDFAPEQRNEFCALWNELVDVQDQGQESLTKHNARRILSLLHTVHRHLHATHTHSPLDSTLSLGGHLLTDSRYMFHQCSEPTHAP